MGYNPLLHLGVVAIEKGAFGSSSTKVANFTYIKAKINNTQKNSKNKSCEGRDETVIHIINECSKLV